MCFGRRHINFDNNCFIGLNTTVRNRISIPSFTLIGCASNIVKSIEEENTVWIGNPASKIVCRTALETIIK